MKLLEYKPDKIEVEKLLMSDEILQIYEEFLNNFNLKEELIKTFTINSDKIDGKFNDINDFDI